MISFLTLNLANEICSGQTQSLLSFYLNAKSNEFFLFSHFNFFYSYPEYGKQWKNEKICEFHRVNISCNCCKKIPDRNYAGVGNIWLMKSNKENRDFVCLCNSCKQWKNTTEFKPIQIQNIKLQQLKLDL
jgi:hypothetical protein